MRAEPQAASYRPDTPIETLADWIGDAVEPADFPKTELRFRNERHAATVGLEDLSDADWLRHFGRFEPLAGNLPRDRERLLAELGAAMAGAIPLRPRFLRGF